MEHLTLRTPLVDDDMYEEEQPKECMKLVNEVSLLFNRMMGWSMIILCDFCLSEFIHVEVDI